MTTRLTWLPRRARAVSGALLGGALLLLGSAAHGQAIVEVRSLDFGGCDAVPGATITVAAAASAGAGACVGATSAQFTVSYAAGDPRRRARIQLVSTTASLANGAATFTASLTDSQGNPGVCLGAGLTVYVGGSVTLPAGAMASGPYIGTAQIQATYTGPSNCP